MKDLCKEKVAGLIPAGDTNPFKAVSEAKSKEEEAAESSFS